MLQRLQSESVQINTSTQMTAEIELQRRAKSIRSL
jgi:hypothetical protein